MRKKKIKWFATVSLTLKILDDISTDELSRVVFSENIRVVANVNFITKISSFQFTSAFLSVWQNEFFYNIVKRDFYYFK